MKLSELCEALSLTVAAGSTDDVFDGVYAGDLLSRAMSHVEAGNLWITIMSNINVIAVASLTEAAAVLLAEDVELVPEALEAAQAKGITVLLSPLTVYELCVKIAALVS
ncbi:MAG: hypothetical protein ACI4V1_01265 [Eubacteriales bacterium]